MIFYYIGSFAVAFLAVILAVPVTRKWALRVGFIDVPMGVKTHDSPTPLGGGMAVYAGSIFLITAALALLGFEIPRGAIGIIAGTTLATIVGLYDDYFQMGPLPKIVGEFIAAIIFLSFIERFPSVISFPAYVLVATFWIIGLQNAINFIDNLDGMCGGISLTIAVGFGILFLLKGMPVYAIISFGLAGGALGFLRYNLPPAKIFLGDGGSLLFGFALACLGIIHLNSSKTMAGALAPFLIMAFPIFDMTLVTITRLNKGIKVYIASKDHAWDMIRFLGLTRVATVNSVLFINFILVCSGILLFFIEGSPLQTLLVVAFGLMLAFVGSQLYKNFLYLRYSIISILTDLFAVNFSFVIYYLIKYKSGLLSFASYVPPGALAVPLAWINIFWIILFSALGLYDVPFERRFFRQFRIISKSVAAAAAIFLFLNYKPGEGFQISIVSTAIFIGLLFGVLTLARGIIHAIYLDRLRKSSGRLNTMSVRPSTDGNPDYRGLAPNSIYSLLGYIGPDSDVLLPRLGALPDMRDILRETGTARLILDLEDSDYSDLRGIFKSAYYMETIFLAPSGKKSNLLGLRRFPTVDSDLHIISIRLRSLVPLIIRRLADAALALLLIVILSPYWTLKSLLRKSEKREEPGYMEIINQREDTVRIRRYQRLDDELRLTNPWVLLAVVRGWIGFYGVTVDTVSAFETARDVIPGYWRKLLVKPGLFGPGYAAAEPRERFELDLLYLEKSSFSGDFLMILRQILRLNRKGRR